MLNRGILGLLTVTLIPLIFSFASVVSRRLMACIAVLLWCSLAERMARLIVLSWVGTAG